MLLSCLTHKKSISQKYYRKIKKLTGKIKDGKLKINQWEGSQYYSGPNTYQKEQEVSVNLQSCLNLLTIKSDNMGIYQKPSLLSETKTRDR